MGSRLGETVVEESRRLFEAVDGLRAVQRSGLSVGQVLLVSRGRLHEQIARVELLLYERGR